MTSEPQHPLRSESDSRKGKSFTRYIPAVVRFLLGVPLVIFGLNCFLNFIPPPPTPLPEGAAAFSGALLKTGYMMQLIGITQLVVGVLLVINRFVPLALVLIAPFFVNSLAFHLFLETSGLAPALVFTALTLYLAWCYRKSYGPLLTARATPV